MSNTCGQGCGCYEDACFDRKETKVAVRDPVCGKTLDCESPSARKFMHEGEDIFFCSTKCLTDFINDPKAYMEKKGFFSFLKWF